MKREIYIVTAVIVDANGTYNALSGYPKTFDSKNYNGNAEIALKRALGDFHEVVGAMCKRDDRQLQSAGVTRLSDGAGYEQFISGEMTDLPEPAEE